MPPSPPRLHPPSPLRLADPTKGPHADSVERLVEAVAVERARGAIQILVTHDHAFAERVADARIALRAGRRVTQDAAPYRAEPGASA